MIILTGTTGNLGSRVLQSLLDLKLIPPSELIISSSNPDKVSPAAREAGVQIRHGDFTNPQTLVESFKGADALFLVSFPSPAEDRWKHHIPVIDAAKEAGVKTIIYTSLMFGGKDGMKSIAGVQQAHIKTAEYLMQSGMDYLIIREGIYAESWWLYSGYQPKTFKKGDTSELDWVIGNDGPVAWVSWDDLGEGTARILSDYKKYKGIINLTGPRATSITGISKLVEKETGRKVNVKIVGKEEAAKYHKEKKSLPEASFWVIDSWSGWHDALANDEGATVDPLLGQILGREPKGIEELAGKFFSPQ